MNGVSGVEEQLDERGEVLHVTRERRRVETCSTSCATVSSDFWRSTVTSQ